MSLNLSADTLGNLLNQTLPFYIKNELYAQADQATPALRMFREKKETFSGGIGEIRFNTTFDPTMEWESYSGDDQLSFNKGNNTKQASYEWSENHLGLTLSFSELKAAGFSITSGNSAMGDSFQAVGESDMIRITNHLKSKYEEMDFSSRQSFSKDRIWSDGTNGFAGIPALITGTPTVGVTGGISRVTNTKWRNRALVGASKISYSVANQTLTSTLREEVRLLRVNNGNPDMIFVGNKFMKALELEAQDKGQYTQVGFGSGKTQLGIKGLSLLGVGDVVYEPALDDLGFDDYAYILDSSKIKLFMLDGDDMVTHLPARPYDRMTFYKSITWTGAMVAKQLNSSGVYQVNDSGL